MVHAESSKFRPGASKREVFTQLLEEAQALFAGQRNWVCNLANTSSLLWHAYKSLPAPSCEVNWAGFYTLNTAGGSELILGPFHGRPACQSIAFGRGVCGTAAAEKRVVRVRDVREFPGHITCDEVSRSEVVVPVVSDGKVLAIIDVDCAVVGGFDEVDEEQLRKLASLIGESCDWGT